MSKMNLINQYNYIDEEVDNMDIEQKRKEIRLQYFSTGGMIVVSILGIVGFLMVYFSGIFEAKSMEMIYKCIFRNGMLIIFGAFFFFIFLLCVFLYFSNVIMKPKKEVLFLVEMDGLEPYFIDKKGKKYEYDGDKNNIHTGYYNVIKTRNYILGVEGNTNDSWPVIEKKSYWPNFYSPYGNFEGILLLPIVYVIALPGILSFLMSKGTLKLFGILFCAYPIYIILYDSVQKIKLKKISYGKIDDDNNFKLGNIIKNIIIILIIVLFYLKVIDVGIDLFKVSNSISKFIVLPLFICILCVPLLFLSKMYKNELLEKILIKIIVIMFLTDWFGLLSFITINTLRGKEDISLIFFTIPFWIAGIFILYKYIIEDIKK